MQTFLVERDLAGISMADLHMATAAALRHSAKMREAGDRIYYLGSTFLPEEGRCLCLFEAKNAEVVAALNSAARLQVSRILPAMTLATTIPVMA
ncbi:MAG: nickel-binding protein [Paracoccaceae bacterium]